MIWLVLRSWLLLLSMDLVARFGEFKDLHESVRGEPVRLADGSSRPSEELCRAVDYACVFYFKPVLCLQRSAATTVLLRRHGWHGEMVIGAQILPFKSHAWVEIDGAVVNDKPYTPEIYQVLARC